MESSKPVIRAIAESDLESIIALDASITGGSRRGFYAKRMAASQASPDAFIWLAAFVEGKLGGFVATHILDGEFGGTAPMAILDSIGILPELRGQGLAGKLMEALEIQLKARQIKEIRTEAAWVAHELVQFFATAGFQLAPSIMLESNIATNF